MSSLRFRRSIVPTTRTCPVAFQHTLDRPRPTLVLTTLKNRILRGRVAEEGAGRVGRAERLRFHVSIVCEFVSPEACVRTLHTPAPNDSDETGGAPKTLDVGRFEEACWRSATDLQTKLERGRSATRRAPWRRRPGTRLPHARQERFEFRCRLATTVRFQFDLDNRASKRTRARSRGSSEHSRWSSPDTCLRHTLKNQREF